MELFLQDKKVLVAGSSKGIGKAIAQRFNEEGSHVLLCGRNSHALRETQNEFLKRFPHNSNLYFSGDLAQEQDLSKLHELITKNWGVLDHLICNIGSGKSVAPLEEDDDEIERMLKINFKTSASCVNKMKNLIIESARLSLNSSITFISSICGIEVLGCPVAYASAKSALQTYSKNLSRALGKHKVRVNCVSPGNILFSGSTWEDKLKQDKEGVEQMIQSEVALQRFGTPEEIASIVVFLASQQAQFVTGVNWVVDGGQTRT